MRWIGYDERVISLDDRRINNTMPVEVPKQRVLKYSQALMGCSGQAAAYGKCVAAKSTIKKAECEKEFLLLKECMQAGIKKIK